MAAKTKSVVGGVVGDLVAEFSRYEAELEQLRKQRDVAMGAPRPLAEALQDVPRVIGALAAKVEAPAYFLARDAVRGWGSLATHLLIENPPPAAALLARVCPDAMAEWLGHELAASYGRLPQPLTPAERDQRLLQLDREIAETERRWAEGWWQAVDAGIQVDPPRGISGEALLGLPGA